MGARAIRAILGDTWAIRDEESLDNILSIAAREHEFASGDLQALEQRLGRPLANTERVTLHDNVAVIPVTGPLFRYANLMTDLSGATSYATVATDLRAAVDNPVVSAIVLRIDSPGGQTNGVSELAQQIREVRGKKPIIAFVGGDACSAAYWLASSADEIVGTKTSVTGSIGATISVAINEAMKPGEKRYSFVSTQSPLKNASPDTDDGKRETQRLTNELGQAFVESVANNRGITVETVLENYGKGAVFTGMEALRRGMIDSIDTLENIIFRFNNKPAVIGGKFTGALRMPENISLSKNKNFPETLTAAWVSENHPAVAKELRDEGAASVDAAKLVAEARAEGVKAECARIAGIEALAKNALGAEAVVAECKADPGVTVEKAAVRILQSVQFAPPKASAGAAHLRALQEEESSLTPPQAGNGTDTPPSPKTAVKATIELARAAGLRV